MILMNQIMAMKHIHPIPRRVFSQHLHHLVDAQQHDVFERGLLVFEYGTLAAGAFHDLEVDEVHMYWMGGVAAVVLELPELDFAPGRFGEDAVLHVGEGYAVDGPLPVAVWGSMSLVSPI